MNPLFPGTAPAIWTTFAPEALAIWTFRSNTYVRALRLLCFREHKDLGFDISSYNLTNTPQYGYPSVPGVVGVVRQGLAFEQITNTIKAPRQFQFGARFTF